jgi:biopolymer transport protein ExbD
MKFPRNAKVFRGQMDVAPFAGVFFLLTIFLTFQTSLVYLPGLPGQMDASALPSQRPTELTIDSRGHLSMGKRTYGEKDWVVPLRADLVNHERTNGIIIRAHSSVTNTLVSQVLEVARQAGVRAQLAGQRLELPMAENLAGARTNPRIMVAVDLSGQIYFENQPVPEDQLPARLAAAVKRIPGGLSLVLLADKTVPYDTIVRLSTLARTAGITEVLLAARPVTFRQEPP